MLKKGILLFVLVLASVLGYSQNEVGGYIMPQYTRILNSDDVNNPQYDTKHSYSKGLGVNLIHFFKGKRDTRKSNRYAVRFDLLYSGHSQKWTATYRKGQNAIGETIHGEWEGKKRLDYMKFATQFEVSHPFNKHLSIIYFTGPQISYLIDVDGGIVVWEDKGAYDYFDLPPADRAYYKSFTIDAVAGMGFDYEYTKWVNITGGLRADFSITGTENADAVVNGYEQIYNAKYDRRGSHNFTLGIFMGLEYTIHKAQFAKTRF